MKAVIWTQYGPPSVLQIRELEKPTPKANEVLIRVYAATVLIADCELRSLKFAMGDWWGLPIRIVTGIRKPTRRTILGQELAGEIEAVGPGVTQFKQGDAVLAPTKLLLGAYAEYVCLPETYPVLKPASMTYEAAATLPTGGIYGWHLMKMANVQSGQSVLINGAGGSIGTYAIQIAKSVGAEVWAVDSGEKLAMLRSLGADHVIDYTQEDFTRLGETYDVIIDVVGKSHFSRSIKSLKHNGAYVLGNPSPSAMIRAQWAANTSDKRIMTEAARHQPEYFTALIELIEAGKVKPIIDKCFPLDQIAEAHSYVEQGHKKGSVVITFDHPGDR